MKLTVITKISALFLILISVSSWALTPDVCTPHSASLILLDATQNKGRVLPKLCSPRGFALSSGINLDFGKFGNRNTDLQGVNYKDASFNDIYLNLAASMNVWIKAFASIEYNNTSTANGSKVNHYSYSNVYANDIISLEQAYATLNNFDISPIYVQIGKQFQDFGRYQIHPITRSMTQVMSETLATSGKIGFITTRGFNGSLFAFDNPVNKITSSATNYGAALGFAKPSNEMGFALGMAYLYNLMGVNDIAHAITHLTSIDQSHRRVGGIALYSDINSGPFTLDIRFTDATHGFKPEDLPKNGQADVNPLTHTVYTNAQGARPWALGAEAGYTFEAFHYPNQNIYVGYQTSHEASGLGLPKHRYVVGYGIPLIRNTNVGVEWDHDNAYRVSQGGANRSRRHINLVSFRASVNFS